MFSILEIIIVFYSLMFMYLLENFLAEASDDFFNDTQSLSFHISLISNQIMFLVHHLGRFLFLTEKCLIL